MELKILNCCCTVVISVLTSSNSDTSIREVSTLLVKTHFFCAGNAAKRKFHLFSSWVKLNPVMHRARDLFGNCMHKDSQTRGRLLHPCGCNWEPRKPVHQETFRSINPTPFGAESIALPNSSAVYKWRCIRCSKLSNADVVYHRTRPAAHTRIDRRVAGETALQALSCINIVAKYTVIRQVRDALFLLKQ